MGLGLHGGGVAAARFFAEAGSHVTVTDMQSPEVLKPSVEKLKQYPIRFVLGEHRDEDFKNADFVIKNPAVPGTSPFLKMAPRVETDISIFLHLAANPIIAVTGSKGKSTVTSAVHHTLLLSNPQARLGGNITVSPLSFLPGLLADSSLPPVVLELSSWQLADLKDKRILKPKVAAITNILPDHQNRYSGMDEYIADKKVIYQGQSSDDWTIINGDDPVSPRFEKETRGQILTFTAEKKKEGYQGAWLENDSGYAEIGTAEFRLFRGDLALPGFHNRINLLCAGLILAAFGEDEEIIQSGLNSFTGIRHRLEIIKTVKGVSFYNDSAATIPHATAEAVKSFNQPVHLIMGGTDKKLDFSILKPVLEKPKEIYILSGSAFPKIEALLAAADVPFKGPFESLSSAVESAFSAADSGDAVVLSPGCASFGMFLNEFHRGDEFVRIVQNLE